MAKFNSQAPVASRPRRTISPVRTTTPALTHNAGQGFSREAESELFLLAATNFVQENTVYESASQRDSRYADLIAQVTRANPAFIAGNDQRKGLARYLREDLFMRSAAVVMAAEYVRAGGPNGRSVVNAVLQRPDEPAEMLGYWASHYGKPFPMAIKRGVADAVLRLYNEKSAIKYDGQGQSIRFGDIIQIVHPRPKAAWQSDLFKYLIDKRYDHVDENWMKSHLAVTALDRELIRLPEDLRRDVLRHNPGLLTQAGWNWERLAGWLPGGMDAEAWEFAIPQMGYMALLRNLRNFDEKGVSDEVKARITAFLSDPEQVANSHQFPFRFWSAYRNAPSLTWASALEKATDLSTGNIPQFDGDTEVYVDLSGSMWAPMSAKSSVQRWEAGALIGMSLFKRAGGRGKVVVFATNSRDMQFQASTSVLRGVEAIRDSRISGGTNTWQALDRHYGGAKRVVIVTDEQANPGRSTVAANIPLIYVVNLAGYAPAMMENGANGRFALGGFSDASFTIMKLLEDNRNSGWPF